MTEARIIPDMPAAVYHRAVEQGSEEWLAARCGILTASEMKLLFTPDLKPSNNEKMRAHVWELAAQRITGHVEPHYVSDDMLRGQEDEFDAKILYNEHYAPFEECGFITNDKYGFKLGYSPDALVGVDGLIEVKSRRQRFQVETTVQGLGNPENPTAPKEFALQIQTGLLVSEREWCDFISYSGGLPMVVIRVYPDAGLQSRILKAAEEFEKRIAAIIASYRDIVAAHKLISTERKNREEILL